MVRVPTANAQPTGESISTKRVPRGQGRRVKQGTVLARVMTQRHIHERQIAAILHCSDRGLYDMMALRRAVPIVDLGALCDYLDMDHEELVDERNDLLED